MIIWLASYPKSGNTLVRSMLSAYLFSKDGKFNFDLLKNIRKFPDFGVFKNLGVDITDENEVVKNYIYVQKEINKRDGNSIRFLKTHAALNDINGHKFTDLKNTLGAIYIVRDPRKIVLSYANHSQITLNESLDRLIELRTLGGEKDEQNQSVTHVGSWSSNYQSWKEFKKIKKYLLIKYEDLIYDKKNTILKVFEFIGKLLNQNIAVDDNKLKKCIVSTDFKKMKSLEIKETFYEAPLDTKNGGRKPFFKLGPNNDYKKLLDKKNRDKIEKHFKLEMSELGYI